MRCKPVGTQPSPILFVGEAPGANEEREGLPLVGGSGDELLRMLIEAGLVEPGVMRNFEPGAGEGSGYTMGHMVRDGVIPGIRLTNVSSSRPPGNQIDNFFLTKTEAKKRHIDEVDGVYPIPSLLDDLSSLEREVQDTNPDVIIAAGNTALWALTGQTGIMKWRGSSLPTHRIIRPEGRPYRVIPILHPAFILRQWTSRAITVSDLRQRIKPAVGHPTYVDPWDKFQFVTTPTYDQARDLLGAIVRQLREGPLEIAVDIETMYQSQISSIAFALDGTTAFCIPILCSTDWRGYWSLEEEFQLIMMMRHILSHPNACIIGQNYPYDMLYLFRLWCVKPRLDHDTRTIQRVCFPTSPASLDYLASMYSPDHQYWKDENKEALANEDDERRWRYNCRDAVETFNVYVQQTRVVSAFHLDDQADFLMALHEIAFYIGQRGIRARQAAVDALRDELSGQILDLEGWFIEVVGPRVGASTKAKNWWSSPKQVATLLFDWFKIPPELDRKTKRPSTQNDHFPVYIQREPLVKPILDRLDAYRSKITFLRNVLNSRRHNGRFVTDYVVPGTETFRFASRHNGMGEGLNLQNVPQEYRVIFGPDAGFLWWEADLERADAQIVAAEAGDLELLDAFEQGVDIHQMNADTIGCTRQEAKAGVHLTNYGGKPLTLAKTLHVSISDAKYFQDKWFEAHPKIRQWHLRIESQVMTQRVVENKFGFRRQFFERLEDAFTEALAWIPQSTVAIIINKGMLRIWRELMPRYRQPNGTYLIEVLTQTHDSCGGQWHESIHDEIRPLVRDCLRVEVPYPRPLYVGVELKTSAISWGDVKLTPWA